MWSHDLKDTVLKSTRESKDLNFCERKRKTSLFTVGDFMLFDNHKENWSRSTLSLYLPTFVSFVSKSYIIAHTLACLAKHCYALDWEVLTNRHLSHSLWDKCMPSVTEMTPPPTIKMFVKKFLEMSPSGCDPQDSCLRTYHILSSHCKVTSHAGCSLIFVIGGDNG